MAAGEKPTSFDIAALAGVSQPTVSRALRGDQTVSAATRLRIEAIARQLNYKVDKNASALRRGSTSTLALLFFEDPAPDGSRINPFFLSMLGPILHTCGAAGTTCSPRSSSSPPTGTSITRTAARPTG